MKLDNNFYNLSTYLELAKTTALKISKATKPFSNLINSNFATNKPN